MTTRSNPFKKTSHPPLADAGIASATPLLLNPCARERMQSRLMFRMIRRPVIRAAFDLGLGVAVIGPFDHQIFLGKLAHLAMQFNFIAGHFARVFNADVVAAKTERFNEGD
jgi:hypothetical protein